MCFQTSPELQETSDVTKTAWKRAPNSRGSKMKWAFTGWPKVNPGNLEQSLRRRVKNTRRPTNAQNRGQTWRKSTPKTTESQNSQPVPNTKPQRQPAKPSEDWCNTPVLSPPATRWAEQPRTPRRRPIWPEVTPVNAESQKPRHEATTESTRQAVAPQPSKGEWSKHVSKTKMRSDKLHRRDQTLTKPDPPQHQDIWQTPEARCQRPEPWWHHSPTAQRERRHQQPKPLPHLHQARAHHYPSNTKQHRHTPKRTTQHTRSPQPSNSQITRRHRRTCGTNSRAD